MPEIAVNAETRTTVFDYLRAGFPVLYVQTWEEQRTEQAIVAAASDPKLNRRVLTWACTRGWGEGVYGHEKIVDATKDPNAALAKIDSMADGTVFVMRDFHPYLKSIEIVRRVRDMIPKLKANGRTLIFESSVVVIPTELEKDVTLVTVPLPTHDEIGAVLDDVIANLGGPAKAAVEDRIALMESARGLTIAEAENVFSLAAVKHFNLSNVAIRTVMREAANIVKKSGLLEFIEPEESLADIGGLNNLKSYLNKRARAYSDEARAYGLPTPRGLLMVGVQGCGKSLTARAIAALMKRRLLRLDMGRLFAGLVGSSEENTRKVFAIAEAVSPCVLWCDEFEQAFKGMAGSGASTDSGTTARVGGAFLTWLSDKKAPVYVVATSNGIKDMPPQLYRKGRFDEIFFVDLPTQQERAEQFPIHLAHVGRDAKKFNVSKLAVAADRFSGAELKEAVTSAMWDAFDDDVEVTTDHILAAIEKTHPLAKTAEREIEELREWAKDRTVPATTVLTEPPRARRIRV